MPTLLLSRSVRPEANALASLAREQRWNVQWLNRRHGPKHLHGKQLGLYAETDVALRVARLHDLALIEPSLGILPTIPHEYLARDVRFMSLGEAESTDRRIFVKPADCTAKIFDAAVYESGRRILRDDDASLTMPVLVSEPVTWENEYRAVVLERRIVGVSPYIRGGWLARNAAGQWPITEKEAEAVLTFCQRFLADRRIELPPAFVLDVGTIRDRGWAVVELNPVWCSGLLGCNLAAILPALDRACRRRAELSLADAQWVVSR